MTFVDRKAELEFLRDRSAATGAELIIVYGRRRVGKSELLKEALRRRKAIYFAADLGADQDQRRRLSEAVNLLYPSPFLQGPQPPSWDALLKYVCDLGKKARVLLILDEFPYLCSSQPALPSILQRIWDDVGKESNLFLILCGSLIGFMEREVLGHKSPLYGRRTGQLLLEPLGLSAMKEFYPRYSTEERISAYAILGGVPAYLLQFSDKLPLYKNIETRILQPTAFLHDEVRFILMEELRDPKHYLSILQSIAFGNTRMNDIVQRTGLDRGPVSKYLSVLQDLRLTERETPSTETRPEKSRRGIYRLSDNFFRFWFRFVFPYKGRFMEAGAASILEREILPQLDNFMGQGFDRICIEILRHLSSTGRIKLDCDRVGRWWDGNEEIDIVALSGKIPVFAAECKWSKKPVGMDILENLRCKVARLAPAGKAGDVHLGLFSRSGFTKELLAMEKQKLVDLVDIRKTGL